MANLLRDWLLDPLALLFLLSLWLCLKLVRCRPWLGGLLACLWIGAVLFASAPAIVNPVIAATEDRYPANPVCPLDATLVVLGGGVDSRVQRADEFERMSPATLARLAEGLRRLAAQPYNRLVLAGGALRTVSEAAVMADFAQRTGVQPRQLLIEGDSQSTADNAVRIEALLSEAGLPLKIQLITSALHLPRARIVFERRGFEVCGVPVDHQALRDVPWYALMPQVSALLKFDQWLHEQLALQVYRLQGRL